MVPWVHKTFSDPSFVSRDTLSEVDIGQTSKCTHLNSGKKRTNLISNLVKNSQTVQKLLQDL